MASWQAYFASWLIKRRLKPRLYRTSDVAGLRRLFTPPPFKTPHHIRITPATLNGVPGEFVVSQTGAANGTMLYLHGGGYAACSAETHRSITCAFAKAGYRVFAPNYRLAPEHPFPAAVEDAVAAYRGLPGSTAEKICLGGDSAGGGLAVALLLALRDAGDTLPYAAVLFSPWTDLAATGGSLETNDRRCSVFHGSLIAAGGRRYLAVADPRNPLASPLYGDLRNLPPLLIHAGTNEVLLDDSVRLAERARQAGVPVSIKLWPVVHHCWQLMWPRLPEARQSINEAAAFLHNVAHAESTSTTPPPVDGKPEHTDILIIGAGFSGLGMAIRLRKVKLTSFLIIEKAAEIGGTWWENHYPGCACDIPSHLYSFSFDLNPSWSRMYSGQPEILAYLKTCAARYGVLPHIRLNTTLTEAVWDEANLKWHAKTSSGQTITARAIVSGMGALHIPHLPEIPGLGQFEGPAFHSSRWDHSVSLAGKHIAVIGTGASSIQFVPQIAPEAGHLTLFQRTPAWILPRLDFEFSERARRRFLYRPSAKWLFRKYIFWVLDLRAGAFLGSKFLARKAQEVALRHLHRHVKDPQLREKLTPKYGIGCKRILISSDFYPALGRPNVELVTEPIAEIRKHSVVTADGVEHPADVLIYGTGFKITELARGVHITGRGGVLLEETWRERMSAYLGMTVHGFPNLFFLLGPNTGLGHNSVVLMIEAQVRYIMKCLQLMRRHQKRAIDVRPESFSRFLSDIAARLKSTVWQSGGCRSWYQDPRTRENIAIWPGSVVSYLRATRRVNIRDYDWL